MAEVPAVRWGWPAAQTVDMEAAFGERMHGPEELIKVREDGRLGRKNKRGFYGAISEEDHIRIEMLQSRYDHLIAAAGGRYD